MDGVREECVRSAEHWERLAGTEAGMAEWNRDHGLDLSVPGQSPGDHRAETYRMCARTLRLQAATGEPHCMCHELPTRICMYGGSGVRV